jgi:hypothetical protein
MPEITAPGANPLRKYFRQPKVYLNLPSNGEFYPQGTFEMPDTGEIPVYAMTAKDELAMKTPDALLNGQATVDVIASCCPSIKDPWQMPSVDLDAVLIAIRIATFGEDLEITTKVPVSGEERTYHLDLRQVLQKITGAKYETVLEYNDFLIKLRPLTYKEFTDSNLKTFEEQRVFKLVNDDKIEDNEKLAAFNKSFKKLTELTMGMLANSIVSITVEGDEVTNPLHIRDFIENSEKALFNAIMEHLEEQKKAFEIEPLKIKTEPEDIEKGAPETFEVPVTFDQSNFFA